MLKWLRKTSLYYVALKLSYYSSYHSTRLTSLKDAYFLTSNQCKNRELKRTASELQPLRIPVLSCKSADSMKQLQIMKTRKQNSSTFISFHASCKIKSSNPKSLKKPLFTIAKCFCWLNFMEFSPNFHWKGQGHLFQSWKKHSPLGVHWFLVYITHSTQDQDPRSSGLPISQSQA